MEGAGVEARIVRPDPAHRVVRMGARRARSGRRRAEAEGRDMVSDDGPADVRGDGALATHQGGCRFRDGDVRSERAGRAYPPKPMITILNPEDHDRWLTGGFDDVVACQQPYAADRMTDRGPVFPTRQKTSLSS